MTEAGPSVAVVASLLLGCSAVAVVDLDSSDRSSLAADTTGEVSGPEVAVTLTDLSSWSASIAALVTVPAVDADSEEEEGLSVEEDTATVDSAEVAAVVTDGEAAPTVDAAASVPLWTSALKTALLLSDGAAVGLGSVTAWILT